MANGARRKPAGIWVVLARAWESGDAFPVQ
jgi:hypothetical protein